LTVIRAQLDTLQKSVDRLTRDMGNDRKDIQDNQIRLGALEGRVTQLIETVEQVPRKVGDKVEDAMQPITDTLDQVQTEKWWTKHFKIRR